MTQTGPQNYEWSLVQVQRGGEELVRHVWQRAVVSGGTFDASYAVFQRARRHGDPHELTLYFTPSARQLATIFGGRRCAQPSRRGLQLLAGSPSALALIFAQPSCESCSTRCTSSSGATRGGRHAHARPKSQHGCLQDAIAQWRLAYRKLQEAEARVRELERIHSDRAIFKQGTQAVVGLAATCDAAAAAICAAVISRRGEACLLNQQPNGDSGPSAWLSRSGAACTDRGT